MTITAQLLGQALIAAGNVLLGNAQSGSVASLTATATMTPQQAATMTQTVAQPVLSAAAQAATGESPLALSAAAQAATGESLLALIQPHIGNEAIKGALGVAMRNLGIQGLPEAQPHQYSALYSAFEGVLAQYGVGGPAPAAAVTSII
jgi:hypothetical protein